MKIFLIIIIILSSFSISVAQTEILSNSKKADSTLYNHISKLYMDAYDKYFHNLPGVELYGDTIKKLSLQNNFDKGLAYAHEVYGISFMNKTEYISARDEFRIAKDIYSKYKDTLNLANIHTHLGILYKIINRYDKSIENYFKAIKLYDNIKDLTNLGRSYFNLSNVYIHINNYDKAEEILKKSQDILKKADSEFGVALTKINLATVYYHKKQYSTAWQLIDEADKILQKYDYPPSKVGVYQIRGDILNDKNNFKEAEKNYILGINLATKLNLQDNLIALINSYSKALYKQNKLDSALSFLHQTNKIIRESKNYDEVEEIYQNYANIYLKLNKLDSAFKYSNLSSAIKDSIYNFEMLNRINDIDVIFSIYEKDKYIASLKQEQKIQDLELQKNELNIKLLVIASIAIFLLLLFISIFLYYRNKKIREKVKLKEQITSTEEKLNLILAGTDQGIFGLDLEGNCTFINRSASQLIGYSEQECIGKKIHNLIHHSKIDGTVYPIEQCPICNISDKNFRIQSETLFKKDNSKFIAEISFNPLFEKNSLAGGVITFSDISGRIKAQEEVENSERKYRLLANNSTDVIWTLDLDGHITYISPSIYNLRGFTPEEAINQSIDEMVCPNSKNNLIKGFELAQEEIITGIKKEPIYFEVEQPRKNGTTVWTEIVSKVMYDNNMKPIGVVGLTRNISKRKLAQEENLQLLDEIKLTNELLEAGIEQKNLLIDELSNAKLELEKINNEKDKFFSILAHDLKSPFAGFLGLTDIFANDIESFSKTELQEIGKNMQESASNLYKLLDNLLQWSRMQRGKMEFNQEPFLISSLVEQNIRIQTDVARQKDITMENIVSNDTYVYADIPMMNTILRNLISNALKFTPRGGKILIGESKHSDDGLIKIFVRDNGIGMPPEIKNNLFKIDQKVSRPGTENEPSTGLGLFLCKEFIEKNNGTIWVESEIGAGSTFYITLPSPPPTHND